MLDMLRDLIAHKRYANDAMLTAIAQSGRAASDPELRNLLNHILIANRFWLLAVTGRPFDDDRESPDSHSFDALVQRYRTTHQEESAFLDAAVDADLARIVEHPSIPGGHCSVAQAFMQVCMHSHAHRAQCATLLRRHAGVPPPTDFILWLAGRRT